MEFLEKNLEEIICTTDNFDLNDRGLDCLTGFKKRQLSIGRYGKADIVTFQKQDHNKIIDDTEYSLITVYELKKDKIGISAFLQALRYVKGISRYLTKRNIQFEYRFKIVLIGKSVDTTGSFIYLPDLFNDLTDDAFCSIQFYTYEYTFEGISFRYHDSYRLTEEGF